MYGNCTGNTNLRNHLYKVHDKAYNKAIQENDWKYPLSTQTKYSSATGDPCDVQKWVLPRFSEETFLKYLVRFIVADDQVSCSDL